MSEDFDDNFDFITGGIDKVLAIDNFFNNQKKVCDEFKKHISDIAGELTQLKIENLNLSELVQRQNVIISQLSMFLIKIKDIDDKKFHDILKTHDIDLGTISENIH